MQQFERELELEDGSLRGVSPGAYNLPLQEAEIAIMFLPNGGFSLFCEFAVCPKEKEESIYYQSLVANVLGQETNGAAIGLNERGNMLTISQAVDYNMEYKDFKELLEDFVSTVGFWQERIKTES